MTWWKSLVEPKFIIALVVLGLFGWALSDNPDDETMKGALIAGFAGAWGYWLGSSSGASQTREKLERLADQ